MITFLFEILSIDANPDPKPYIALPEVDIQNFWLPIISAILVFFVFVMLSRMFFFLFKWKMAGSDEEIAQAAKSNIKHSLIFVFLTSLSWLILSWLTQGIIIRN